MTWQDFREHGFATLPGAVSVRELRADADRILTQLELTDPRVTAWRLPTGEAYVLKIKPILDMSSAACRLAEDLTGYATELLGGPAHVMEDKISYKQRVPGSAPDRVLGEEVRKHSDATYFHRRGFGDPIVTLAICIDDCTEASGAVRVWPGSHLQDVQYIETPEHGPVVPDRAAPDGQAVMLEEAAGSVLAWDARLIHASGPNTTGKPRRLLILGYTR